MFTDKTKKEHKWVVVWTKRHGIYSCDTDECTKSFENKREALEFKKGIEDANAVIGNTSQTKVVLTKQESNFDIKNDDELIVEEKEDEWIWVDGFKGMDKDMKGRGYQFEIGCEYEHQDEVKECCAGFHFCNDLYAVFNFYSFDFLNRFFRVNGLVREKDYKDSKGKLVAKKIKILSEITDEEYFNVAKKYYEYIYTIEAYKQCRDIGGYDIYRKLLLRNDLLSTGKYSESLVNWMILSKKIDDDFYKKAIALTSEDISHDVRMLLLFA